MKYLLSTILLGILTQFCSSCRKETEVVLQKDTVRDTVYRNLIRTDSYMGTGQLDCLGGCNYPIDYAAITVVRYYANDSTNYTVALQPFYSGTTNRKEFNFSVVKGAYTGPDADVRELTQSGPAGLKYTVYALFTGSGTQTYQFSGFHK